MCNWYFVYNSEILKLPFPEHKSFFLSVDGYIKTTAVEIDYDSLKLKKNSLGALSRPIEDDQEVYDDVAEQDDISRYGQI